MNLTQCIHEFFDEYLPRVKGVRDNTTQAYRDTFKLFLRFAAASLSVEIDSLQLAHLSPELVLAFLDHLEHDRKNAARTRNQRLAALKSLAKMIRLFYPRKRHVAEAILAIPQKLAGRGLVGFLYPEEILKVFDAVNLTRADGFRDYTLLHLFADSGARATEVATLTIEDFDPTNRTLILIGKGNRYRQIELWPKTTQLLNRYISRYRRRPKPLSRDRIFINQRGEELTRHGIYRLCKKYLVRALPPKRLKHLSPAHCFRHSCAVNMLCAGYSATDIRNRLGHETVQSTMNYLHLDLSRRRYIQKRFLTYTQASLAQDPKIDELVDWEHKQETLAWLDTL